MPCMTGWPHEQKPKFSTMRKKNNTWSLKKLRDWLKKRAAICYQENDRTKKGRRIKFHITPYIVKKNLQKVHIMAIESLCLGHQDAL